MSLDENMARLTLRTRTGNVENVTPVSKDRDFVPGDDDCPRCGVPLHWSIDCPGPHWDLDERPGTEESKRKDRARCDERAVRQIMNLGFSEASARHRLELARLAVVHVPWVATGLLAIAEAKAEKA